MNNYRASNLKAKLINGDDVIWRGYITKNGERVCYYEETEDYDVRIHWLGDKTTEYKKYYDDEVIHATEGEKELWEECSKIGYQEVYGVEMPCTPEMLIKKIINSEILKTQSLLEKKWILSVCTYKTVFELNSKPERFYSAKTRYSEALHKALQRKFKEDLLRVYNDEGRIAKL